MTFGRRTTAAIWRAWADELSGNWLINIAANARSSFPPASIFVQ